MGMRKILLQWVPVGVLSLRFENKEGLDYKKAKKTDYVEACKYGLDRLEYIKQLMLDRGD